MWLRRHPAISSLIAVVAILIMATIGGLSFHVNTLQNELDRSQRIIKQGRQLSKWLLNDFTRVLEDPRGMTYQRSQLADRTQLYLNALLQEAESDRELKADLAFAFSKLAELQGQVDSGSLGQTEQAQENLRKAQKILDSLGNLDSELSQKVQCIIYMQEAGKHLSEQNFVGVQQAIDQAEAILDSNCLLDAQDRLLTEGHIAHMQFEHAKSESDLPKMESVAERLRSISQSLEENDADRVRCAISIFTAARAKRECQEQRGLYQEMLPVATSARDRLSALQGDNPSLDITNYLANLENDIAETEFRLGNFDRAIEHYQNSLQQWQHLLKIDGQNHVAVFNVAHQWSELGDVHIQLQNLDEAKSNLEKSESYFKQWGKQLGTDLTECPDWLYLQGHQATLSFMKGDVPEARRAIQVKVTGMQQLATSNADFRRALGDGLLTAALIEAQACQQELQKWVDGKPHQFSTVVEQAISGFQNASDHFQSMIEDDIAVELIQPQFENAESMLESLKSQREKFEEYERQTKQESANTANDF